MRRGTLGILTVSLLPLMVDAETVTLQQGERSVSVLISSRRSDLAARNQGNGFCGLFRLQRAFVIV